MNTTILEKESVSTVVSGLRKTILTSAFPQCLVIGCSESPVVLIGDKPDCRKALPDRISAPVLRVIVNDKISQLTCRDARTDSIQAVIKSAVLYDTMMIETFCICCGTRYLF